MRLFKFALPLLFVAGLAGAATRAWTDHSDRAARSLFAEHTRSQFFQRAAMARAAPDADRYHAEQRTLLRGWFAEQSDLGNRWPLLRDEPMPFVPPAPHAKGGDLGEFQELAEATVGGWREGRLDLFQTAFTQGLRLDLLTISRNAGTQPHLSVDLAVWGAAEELETEELAGGGQQQRASVPLTFRGLSLRFFDAEKKLIAAMPGEGEPSLRLDLPERLVHDAPPGVVLARYEPGLFPREAAEVEWTLTVQLRTPAGDPRLATATWRSKADPAWAVDAGQAWGEDL